MVRDLNRWAACLSASALLAVGWIVLASDPEESSSATQEVLARQRIQYDDDSPKTILELQRFRMTTRLPLRRADGVSGAATWVNLNPAIGTGYSLTLSFSDTDVRSTYHIENPQRSIGPLRVSAPDPGVLNVGTPNGTTCPVWNNIGARPLDEAGASGLPYAPLCGGLLYLRNPVAGHRTSLERVTDFLRDHVWHGDQVITFVKKELYRDHYLERGAPANSAAPAASGRLPLPALVATEAAYDPIAPQRLAIDIEADGGLLPGQWYAVRGIEGVTVSAIKPDSLQRSLLTGHEASVNPLTQIESEALVYLVAFDLESLELHFALGTEHPRLDWSDRPPASAQDPRLPGPDGVGTAAPLVLNGMVSPAEAPRTIAAFAGGFKRSHGAFKFGPLAQSNHGSHYGFIQDGIVFSKLQPGLATVFVRNDGRTQLKTWEPSDNLLLEHIRYARQNGVPLIEYDPGSGRGIPGDKVNLWGPGNWSGSANEDLRTLRAGMCMQTGSGRNYLLFAYFSAATPSAMARVFQAYQCSYAMHLDMNALEHTYLALYVSNGHQMLVEHLVQGMEEVDRQSGGQVSPRFLGFPDDRDFFYVTREAHRP